jgi:hypothetical protein
LPELTQACALDFVAVTSIKTPMRFDYSGKG